MMFKGEIERKLSALAPRPLTEQSRGVAAVLISLIEKNDEPCFLLTKRTRFVRTHKGQVSFPGGMKHRGDSSLLFTALRETEEEIGVPSRLVEVLGQFHDYRAITGQLVRSFAGILPSEYPLKLHSREVEYVLEVPFDFFRTCQPKIEMRERVGRKIEVYHYDFNGDCIWGLTAKIIRDFLLEVVSD